MNRPAPSPLVSVVDDDDAFRDSLRFLLESAGRRVAAYPTAEAFLAAFDPAAPGCIVLDIRMPGMSGLELQDELLRRRAAAPILFVTGHGDVPIAVEAMKKGAMEFIEKPFVDEAFLQLVGRALDRDADNRERLQHVDAAAARVASLSRREHEVMDLVVQGYTNKAMGELIGVTVKTIESHRARVMQKLSVDSVAELVKLALTARQHA